MKVKTLTVFIVIVFLFTSCTVQNKEVITNEKVKPVRVMSIREENRPLSLEYIGVVESEEIKKISFKSSGKIEKVFVSEDQKIKKGDMLLKLDTEDLAYALDASRANMEAAKAQYEKAIKGAREEEINQAKSNVKKAQDAYDFSKNNYMKTKQLFEKEAISQNSLDKAKLDLDIRETDLNTAKELEKQVINSVREEDIKTLSYQLEQAKADYEHKKMMIESALLVSDVDGYVVDILYEEGEIVSTGYPAIIIRNEEQVVNVGLSQRDSIKVKQKDKVIIKVEEKEVEGNIVTVAQVPNSQTRTYNAKIDLDEDIFQLGYIVKVKIIIGEEKGVWIPITSVLANGIDYVFIVRGDRVEKKRVDIQEVLGTKVKVEGLLEEDILVLEGMKRLRDGDKVIIEK